MQTVEIELPSDVVELVQQFQSRNCPDMSWQDVLSLWVAAYVRGKFTEQILQEMVDDAQEMGLYDSPITNPLVRKHD